MFHRNTAGQKIAIFVYDSATRDPKTGDAANITGYLSIDGAAAVAFSANSGQPTELDSTTFPGVYLFAPTQAETDGDLLVVGITSTTANVAAVPTLIYTTNIVQANVAQIGGKVVTAAAAITVGAYVGNNTKMLTVLNENGAGVAYCDLFAVRNRMLQPSAAPGGSIPVVLDPLYCLAYYGGIRISGEDVLPATVLGDYTYYANLGDDGLEFRNANGIAIKKRPLLAYYGLWDGETLLFTLSGTTEYTPTGSYEAFDPSASGTPLATIRYLPTDTLAISGDDPSTVIQTAAQAGMDASVAAGTAASAASVQNVLDATLNVQNNTFISSNIPVILERPDADNQSVTLTVTFADETGEAKDIDESGTPAIYLYDSIDADITSSRIGAWSHPATGKYECSYTNSSTDAVERLRWEILGTINSKLRRYVASTQIVDTTAVDFTSADRAKLEAVAANPTPPTLNEIASKITTDHGSGSYATATGFATATNVSNAVTEINAHTDEAVADFDALDATETQAACAAAIAAEDLATADDVTVNVLPVQSSTTASGRRAPVRLTAYQYCRINATVSVLDSAGTAVNLAGKTLALVAWARGGTTAAWTLRSDGTAPELTIGGTSHNVVTIDAENARTATAGHYVWRLYTLTAGGEIDDLAADGVLEIDEGIGLPEEEED